MKQWKMENGKWKMENGKWTMENGKWKMENGKWKMENGKWKILPAPPAGCYGTRSEESPRLAIGQMEERWGISQRRSRVVACCVSAYT